MTSQEYVYRITEVVKVVDGDSYWLRVDVGFHQSALINVRLLGYDCPERTKGSQRERQLGGAALAVAGTFLTDEDPDITCWIRTRRDPDSFGRWLGDIWQERGDEMLHMGEALRHLGLASVWPIRWRDEFDKATANA
jgi:endonuclease YncB( thermonuclease family)